MVKTVSNSKAAGGASASLKLSIKDVKCLLRGKPFPKTKSRLRKRFRNLLKKIQ